MLFALPAKSQTGSEAFKKIDIYIPSVVLKSGYYNPDDPIYLFSSQSITKIEFEIYDSYGEIIFKQNYITPLYEWETESGLKKYGVAPTHYLKDGIYIWRLHYNLKTDSPSAKRRQVTGSFHCVD